MCEAAARGGVERRVFGFGLPFLFFPLLYTGGTYATVRVTLFRTFVSVVYIFILFFILLGLDGIGRMEFTWRLVGVR